MSELKEGSVLKGEIVGIKPFGAFVKLESGETGLVHISQVSNKYIEKVEDEFKLGDEVQVKVLSVDPSGKISLSIKALSESRPDRAPARRFTGRKKPVANVTDFEGMMKKWQKSSEERLGALASKQKKNR